ncbi:MAG TPA: hypothetical protein VFY44_03320, partial [Thermoleophilaceae bacterium]|nr:hypothetical protein [Thermoleophilaceae bacterium]
ALSCWDYVQRTGLLNECAPENRALIKAAYEDCYQTSGDATSDERMPTVDLTRLCQLSAARTRAEASGYLRSAA